MTLNLDPITSARCLAAVGVVWILLFLQLYGELRRRERAEGYLWLLRIAAGIFVPTSSVRSISPRNDGPEIKGTPVRHGAPLPHMSGQHTGLPSRNPGRIF